MKSTKFDQIFILLSIVFASSWAVFRPPEDSSKEDQDQPAAPWHSDWAKVVGCERGQTQSRFPACWCGQYAKIVKEVQSIPLEELENEGYHYKWRKGRKIYYVCLPCSSCPDGILMTRKCRQDQDTSCDLDQCIDPHHVFDQGKKACVPNTKELPEPKEQTEDPSIVVDKPSSVWPSDKYESSSLTAHADELEFEDPSQLNVWHQNVVVVIIVVSLVAVVTVNIILIVTVIHRKRMRYRTLTRVASNLSQATTHTGCTCMNETPV